jgi:hypothetical protein
MHIKSITLYSLPYFVGVASLIVAAHQVAPMPLRFQVTSTESSITSDQVVNRSLKSDRLPIKQAAPPVNDKEKRNVKVRSRIAPNPEIKIGCEQPINLDGRCFAGAERARLRAA